MVPASTLDVGRQEVLCVCVCVCVKIACSLLFCDFQRASQGNFQFPQNVGVPEGTATRLSRI